MAAKANVTPRVRKDMSQARLRCANVANSHGTAYRIANQPMRRSDSASSVSFLARRAERNLLGLKRRANSVGRSIHQLRAQVDRLDVPIDPCLQRDHAEVPGLVASLVKRPVDSPFSAIQLPRKTPEYVRKGGLLGRSPR